MEKIICPSCCAPLTLNNTQPFFTCEYCGTTTPNTWYDKAAVNTSEPTLDEKCVALLRQMGLDEQLAAMDAHCFGTPLELADDVRAALMVPQQENVYLLYERYSLLGGLTEGFVLADTGMYYLTGGKTGRRSWESFVTGAISGTEDPGILANGTLSIGDGLTFAVASSDDARIARFVIDLHNRLYTAHTGQNAPASWRFATEEEACDANRTSTPSVAKTVLGAAATLLAGGSILSGARSANTILHPQRHTRPVIQPVVPAQPARRAPVRPGMNLRPGAARPGMVVQPAMPARPPMTARPALNRPRPNGRPGMSDRPGGRGPGGRGRR